MIFLVDHTRKLHHFIPGMNVFQQRIYNASFKTIAMKIYLNPYLKIKDIKRNFENFFPYLKLEFFKPKTHAAEAGSEFAESNSHKDVIPNSSFLVDATGVLTTVEIEINSKQTVAEVEQLFKKLFNLPVQIFRKTRFSSVEIEQTETVTLETEDKIGRKLCNAVYDEDILW